MKTAHPESDWAPEKQNLFVCCTGFFFTMLIMTLFSGCGRKDAKQTPITQAEVRSAAVLSDLEFSDAEIDSMLDGLDSLMVRQTKDAWPNIFRQARTIPAVEYIQASRLRTLLIKEFSRLFLKADVIVFPSFEGDQLLITNLTGHPAISVPSGFDAQGMPTSVTFVSNWFCEQNILLLARAYQEATQWYKKTPPNFTPSK